VTWLLFFVVKDSIVSLFAAQPPQSLHPEDFPGLSAMTIE